MIANNIQNITHICTRVFCNLIQLFLTSKILKMLLRGCHFHPELGYCGFFYFHNNSFTIYLKILTH